jgi:hypothetical protein
LNYSINIICKTVKAIRQKLNTGNNSTGGPEMKVDVAATKAKLLGTGRKILPWARIKGLDGGSMRQYLNGRYVPPSGGEFETKAIRALKEDDLLVVVTERRKKAA